VILLDEVDKMSADFRGDPSAALLEVLDPEQNSTFQDHYLDVEYDLSQVMFIATANVLHTIPQPLQDRMEILRLPGYTEYEKVEIAKRFLVAKEMEATGVTAKHLEFTCEGIQAIVRSYTREAGVRNLNREISSICRKVARTVVDRKTPGVVRIEADNLSQYIGVPKFRPTRQEEKDEVGFVTGLAWTEVGGEILPTEATLMSGRGKLTLTGKLGEVMQESARAAMSFVRSRAHQFGIPKDFHRRLDLHIHVPEGAIPKDGPSAGVTMATSLISTLTGIPVRSDVAMTGEITLRGKVLPIGGVKEKLLAAHRAGIRTVILPRDNQKDLTEVPKDIQEEFTVHLVDTMDEVLQVALTRLPTPDDEAIAEGGFPPGLPGSAEVGEGPVMH
jgi:ATP-dependent Lon protease